MKLARASASCRGWEYIWFEIEMDISYFYFACVLDDQPHLSLRGACFTQLAYTIESLYGLDTVYIYGYEPNTHSNVPAEFLLMRIHLVMLPHSFAKQPWASKPLFFNHSYDLFTRISQGCLIGIEAMHLI